MDRQDIVPGEAWLENGVFHISVKGILANMGQPYTLENEEIVVKAIRALAPVRLPGVTVEEVIHHDNGHI
jgi:hypothetical protein